LGKKYKISMAIVKNKRVWFIVLIPWIIFSAFTVPKNNSKVDNQTLFTIARSKDANEIWYTLNTNENGDLNSVNPVNVFWVKKAEDNTIEPLTWIQNQYAYGIKVLETEKGRKDALKFQFVSYNKRTFELKHVSENRYGVFTTTNNKEIEVTKIFIQIDGGSFWLPTVSYVKIFGLESKTGNQVVETIIPSNNKLSDDKNLVSYVSKTELK